MTLAPPPPHTSNETGLRVLLVDDSAVVRRIMLDVLRADPGIELVRAATNGRQALSMIDDVKPHVVILDVEMPDIDGRQTLVELRRKWPGVPVIMFSSVSEKGAAATFEAMAQGAKDFVTKPSMAGSLAGAVATVRSSLIPVVHTWGGINQRRQRADQIRTTRPAAAPPAPRPRAAAGPAPRPSRAAAPPAPPVPKGPVVTRPKRTGRISAVVIASSTGGPNALNEVVPRIPGDISVPVLLVQHMPPTFTRHLAERLNGISALTVVEAEPGMSVAAGHLYVARGGEHMIARRSGGEVRIELNSDPPENSCRPAADVLFRSAASVWGGDVLAVVLTGMGQDGMLGSRAIVDAGGEVIAQDADTSVVWGMPGAVANAGLASEILPLGQISSAIERRITRRGTKQ